MSFLLLLLLLFLKKKKNLQTHFSPTYFPGEEEEAAAPGQRVCPGPATEPGPGLGSVGRHPMGFRP